MCAYEPGSSSCRRLLRPKPLNGCPEAVRLVDASLTARDEGETDWRDSLRRAAELLEWLSHPEMNPQGLPLHLLGAACYLVAGYAARGASLAGRDSDGPDAELLRPLLQGDFERLLVHAVSISALRGQAASEQAQGRLNAEGAYADGAVVREIASALGVVAAEMRWGGGRRTTKALEKLGAAARAVMMVADPYEWLLVKLSAEVAEAAVAHSLRVSVLALASRLSEDGQVVFERYVRLAYLSAQMTLWPSQERGLNRLAEGGSFALCTPTGSGKTRVAEVALLEAMFRHDEGIEASPALCLYIVPTRSLAAEVEARFARVLRRAGGARAVTVTGLYGGTDWGPGDDWLSTGEPTVLICTQEKCEALVRFFGELLLPRLRVVIIDEAHEVRFGEGFDSLEKAESRALRLESLVTRLRTRTEDTRFIAISAVAQHLERPLARWISGDADPEPVLSTYRATRQLVGRLLCRSGGTTRIEYDVLDGQPLEVQGLGDDGPYVPAPFDRLPPAASFTGPRPKKGMAPFALWAAINLARIEGPGQTQSVLISVVEGIGHFTSWCASLLEEHWDETDIPVFFVEPPDDSDERNLWHTALSVTEDFFGEASRELRLLRRGIVVHHGRMPGRLPRLLVELVERRIVRVVIATSTLTQGVNLPFETILIPGLSRYSGRLSAQEFSNLIGRAGRPGVATEGQALVLVLEQLLPRQRAQAAQAYEATLAEWIEGTTTSTTSRSPLAALIEMIWDRWPDTDVDAFETWLEVTSVDDTQPESEALSRPLGVLDAVLLAALAESNESVDDIFRQVWAESFAHYASAEEARLERAFLARGRAVARRFAEPEEQRRVYWTALPPREAKELYAAAPAFLEHLRTGTPYSGWDKPAQLAYVERTIELVSLMPRFEVAETVGASSATWQEVLLWWLDPPRATKHPSAAQVAGWHDFISSECTYKFTWGMTALMLQGIPPDVAVSPEMWAAAGIPWAAIWIKEMLLWGTLDPVAAHLLSRRVADTRAEADAVATQYYERLDMEDDPLDPANIRAWAATLTRGLGREDPEAPPIMTVRLIDDIQEPSDLGRWRVVPLVREGRIEWADVAGYVLGWSECPSSWVDDTAAYDFFLDAPEGVVRPYPFL